MGWQCVPQIIGLVRGEPKTGQKHRANVRAILAELGEERLTASPTYDKTRSALNQYGGISSGFACADDMTQRANEYRAPVQTKNGTKYRTLRDDAVIGWAAIFKPPSDMTVGWTQDEYNRFESDSMAFMVRLEPKLFRKANVKMVARHMDEGVMNEAGEYSRHTHVAGDAIDQAGRYCGNLIDAKLCRRICEEYPAFMRARGWEIDDCDLTDWERMKTDPAYREERRQNRGGKSVTQYAKTQAAKLVTEAAEDRVAAAAERKAAEADRDAVKQLRREAEADRELARRERVGADFLYKQARAAHGAVLRPAEAIGLIDGLVASVAAVEAAEGPQKSSDVVVAGRTAIDRVNELCARMDADKADFKERVGKSLSAPTVG